MAWLGNGKGIRMNESVSAGIVVESHIDELAIDGFTSIPWVLLRRWRNKSRLTKYDYAAIRDRVKSRDITENSIRYGWTNEHMKIVNTDMFPENLFEGKE
jgi:hypothetical protein